ncbi:cupin domain-containing protein [Frigidibacter oleivorans]|uniref:cupin domain-containing protein n=1 Tax=Frigidibacter oleivorans TaxID=2487129 RepID=UPI000F8EDCD8|nr:cupin domain-containing protein [Frigidibacter oleivorans]
MTHFLRLDRDSVEPTVERPDPSVVIAGDPVHTTWLHEEHGSLYAGMWQTTPGIWRVSYSEWEYIHILSGLSILTEDGKEPQELAAGDSVLIHPGFAGTWECVETTLKDFVILE